ncbi:MAG: glycosyltransferase family 39 protein [Anaerolineaceae bacterium]|nr:glycosyltransferase family 39 protein [Anaerolineaceae bacterium]
MTEEVEHPNPINTSWRWLAFLAALLVITMLLLDTPLIVRGIVLAVLSLPVLAIIGGWVRRRQPGAWVRRFPWLQSHAKLLSRWLIGAALVCMMLAALQLRPGTPPDHVLWLILGMLCLLLSYELQASTSARSPTHMPDAQSTEQGRIRWPWLIASSTALVALTLANLPAKPLTIGAYAQAALLLAGIFSIALAFRNKPAQRRAFTANAHWIALIVILLLAAVLRLWNLEWWTARWLDEMIYADATVNLRTPEYVQILTQFNTVTAFSWLYPLMQAPLVNLLGPGLLPLRLLSAGFGLLTVAATYRLGHTLFDRRIGLLAALVLATLPLHLHFSRIGIANIADPLFGVLMLWFLARATKNGHIRDYALAGIMLGLTQYFYEGGRLFFPLLALGLLLMMGFFARRDHHFSPPSRTHLAVFFGCALMLAAPLYITWLQYELPLVPRYEVMQTGRASEYTTPLIERWITRIPWVMRALVHTPDTSWFYQGEQALLLLPLVPFFLLGIGHSLVRLARPSGLLLLVWIGGTIASIAFIHDAGSYPRYLVLLPGLALCISLGLIATWDHLRQKHQLPTWVWGMLAIAIIGVQAGYYFGIHLPNFYDYQMRLKVADGYVYRYDTDNALQRALELPQGMYIHIITQQPPFDYDGRVMTEFFSRQDLQISGVFPRQLEFHLQFAPMDERQAFFIEQDDELTLEILDYYFDLEYVPYDNPLGLPQEALMDLYMTVDE